MDSAAGEPEAGAAFSGAAFAGLVAHVAGAAGVVVVWALVIVQVQSSSQ